MNLHTKIEVAWIAMAITAVITFMFQLLLWHFGIL